MGILIGNATLLTTVFFYINQIFVSVFRQEKAVCEFCQKQFTRKDHLNRHIQETHLSKRKFRCESCGKFFKRRDHVKKHFQSCPVLAKNGYHGGGKAV